MNFRMMNENIIKEKFRRFNGMEFEYSNDLAYQIQKMIEDEPKYFINDFDNMGINVLAIKKYDGGVSFENNEYSLNISDSNLKNANEFPELLQNGNEVFKLINRGDYDIVVCLP